MYEKINVSSPYFKMLTGTPAGKRLLRSPRRRWEDNIRMIKEINTLVNLSL